MDTPFFTVIIPTYNRAELLREAIQSVLKQTYQNFELIIIDDHSTDNTRDVVQSIHDDRICYLLNERTKGASGARNTGIFKAKGEWIAFLDSDDIWLPQKLELQHKQIQKIDENIGFIYAGYMVYDFENKVEIKRYLPEKEGWVQKDMLYSNYVTALPSVAVRKEIVLKLGGFDEQFPAIEDWELFIRIAGVTKFSSLKEVLVYVRKSNKDRLSLKNQHKLTALLAFRQKHRNLLRKDPRLSHRIATIILMWALELREWSLALKSIPWVFIGIVVDPYNFLKTLRGIYLKLIISKRLHL